MLQTFYLIIMLSGFWLLLSGHTDPFMLSCGLVSILLTFLIAQRLNIVEEGAQPFYLPLRIIIYWLWLAREVVKSTWDVTRRIWHPQLPISPVVIHIDTSQTTPTGLMLYANSITLTPGTVCMNVEDNRMEVHALTREAADDLLSGEMDRRVSQLEKKL
ncbi:MAG: Na+/H+ antiporter subunit E [Desulfuromonadaceae bacterium]|nr:Na+/H+ antiporter subunit E [Desulfuromonadaceae bacterium]